MNARRWSDSGAYKLDDQRDDDYGDCGQRRSRKAMSESPVDDDYCATRIVVDEDEPEIGIRTSDSSLYLSSAWVVRKPEL